MSDQHPGSTHFPLLLRAALKTRGPIAEWGAGYFSTQLLHEFSRQGRYVVTFEAEPHWVTYAETMRSPTHEVRTGLYADLLQSSVATDPKWGVVFIDHADGDRIEVLKAVKHLTDLVVIHDATGANDGPWAEYTYHRLDERTSPHTAILSMTDDLSWCDDLRIVK